jgi:hypothetical protein
MNPEEKAAHELKEKEKADLRKLDRAAATTAAGPKPVKKNRKRAAAAEDVDDTGEIEAPGREGGVLDISDNEPAESTPPAGMCREMSYGEGEWHDVMVHSCDEDG